MRRRLLFACLATAIAATPALAQDGSEAGASRTPESANRFLTTVFSQDDAGNVSYDVIVKDRQIQADTFIGGEVKPVSGRLVALTPTERCKALLQLSDTRVANVDGEWKVGSFERTIDWGKVAKVDKTDVKVTQAGSPTRKLYGLWIHMRNNWQKLSLDTPSEQERDRAEFAIEFLRQGCAVADDTGF